MVDKCPSNLARHEPPNQDTQHAPESYEEQTARLLRKIRSLLDERARRQDHVTRTILQVLQTLNDRQDSMQWSLETVNWQLSDIQSLLKNVLRRSEQLSLPPNSQYTQGQGAGTDPLSLPGHLSYSSNTQEDPSLRHLSQLLAAMRWG
jgi:hypothetical protein